MPKEIGNANKTIELNLGNKISRINQSQQIWRDGKDIKSDEYYSARRHLEGLKKLAALIGAA